MSVMTDIIWRITIQWYAGAAMCKIIRYLQVQPLNTYHYSCHGHAQDFFPGVGKLGVWGQKSPSGVHGWSPAGGLRAKPPEADDRWSK